MITKAQVGMVIRGPDNSWEATVTEINEQGDELAVVCQTTNLYTWNETWVLSHTNAGLKRGDYVVVSTEEQTV